MTANSASKDEKPPKVLVVDDDAPILRALQARLGHAGYDVAAARDGAAALLSAGESPPDVALLDINMPGLDGFAVAEKLKTALPGIGLVFLTASKVSDIQTRAETLGARFLEKPFDSTHLMETIREFHD